MSREALRTSVKYGEITAGVIHRSVNVVPSLASTAGAARPIHQRLTPLPDENASFAMTSSLPSSVEVRRQVGNHSLRWLNSIKIFFPHEALLLRTKTKRRRETKRI
ncbi:unnamed protein product, partial [Iphiclides podalirius]